MFLSGIDNKIFIFGLKCMYNVYNIYDIHN